MKLEGNERYRTTQSNTNFNIIAAKHMSTYTEELFAW